VLIHHTEDPLMQLKIDRTRRAAVAGPWLAAAHRDVGRLLALDIARRVVLETVAIEHVKGSSSGVQIQEGGEPVILAVMRAGLFVAEGIWEGLAGSTLVPMRRDDPLPNANPGRPYVIVDSVINTGGSMRHLLDRLLAHDVAKLSVAALVGYRPTVEAMSHEYDGVLFSVGRLSERSYVGKGGTDTGARLFGSTTME
jgi:uracil phosphoribosyltransferase